MTEHELLASTHDARLAAIVPTDVVLVDSGQLPTNPTLHPIEAAYVVAAVERRRLEFATGRACGRQALDRFGLGDLPIRVGPDREPAWPPGIVGTITHCPGFCAAAVARRREYAGIGIDAEANTPLTDGLADLITLPQELNALPDDAGVSWPVVLFSARESVFKAWFPITRRRIEHHDIRIRLDLRSTTFTASARGAGWLAEHGGLLTRVRGTFTWSPTHVFTAAWVRAAQCDARQRE